MTREEAIKLLKHISIAYTPTDAYGDYDDPQPYEEALDMAISALKGGDAKMRNEDFRPSYMQETPSEDGSDLISRANAIKAICNAQCELDVPHYPQCDQVKYCDEIKALLALPSADAEKKKAELKENGDWDCPDVYCDECDHHRSVEWCSLAIPNHEEIDETYKMVNEAFFEGFDSAEKRYRFLIETVEELDKKLADAVEVVRCKDCRHANECHKSIQYTRNEPRTVTMGYSPIEWCSHGERREK